MKPFRKNVAIAIDGGGIRGMIVAQALLMLEKEMGKSLHDTFRLSVGTSTGSILAAGIACGLDAQALFDLYNSIGGDVFKKTFASRLWPFRGFRYPRDPLRQHLERLMKDKTLGDLWNETPSTALIVTTFDLVTKGTRFLKSWKSQYTDWPVVQAVLASSAAPTYFPVMQGRYTDGGIGSYNNPCFMAAYEIDRYLDWDLKETTLISLGTGRAPEHLKVGDADKFNAVKWLETVMESHSQDATDQQVLLVNALYPDLDFRRFQVDLETRVSIDNPAQIPLMIDYGKKLGKMILNDEVDSIMKSRSVRAPKMRKAPVKKSTPVKKSASRRQTSKSGTPKK